MICITIGVEEIGVFLIFFYFFIPCFEIKLVWDFMSFVNFLSWSHYGFIFMVYEIFHSMFERKEIGFYCWIHVSTEAHSDILNIIVILDSAVHEYTNPVIEWSSKWFIIFQLFSNYRCIHEECIFKWFIYWKGWLLEFYLLFFFVPQYSWIIFFMIWSVWSILIPYLILIMWMLSSFIPGPGPCY